MLRILTLIVYHEVYQYFQVHEAHYLITNLVIFLLDDDDEPPTTLSNQYIQFKLKILYYIQCYINYI